MVAVRTHRTSCGAVDVRGPRDVGRRRLDREVLARRNLLHGGRMEHDVGVLHGVFYCHAVERLGQLALREDIELVERRRDVRPRGDGEVANRGRLTAARTTARKPSQPVRQARRTASAVRDGQPEPSPLGCLRHECNCERRGGEPTAVQRAGQVVRS